MPNRDGTGSQGGGRGKMGGLFAAGAGGNCICPQCGHVEPHQQGEPCSHKKCTACGAMLTRQ